MSPEQLVDFVKTFYHNFESGNGEAAAAMLDENIVWENPMPEEIPFGGRYEGRMSVVGYWGELVEALDMGPMDVDQMIAQGDTVMVTGREASTVKATGRNYDMKWVHLFKVRDGQIYYGREYNNTAEMLQAFV